MQKSVGNRLLRARLGIGFMLVPVIYSHGRQARLRPLVCKKLIEFFDHLERPLAVNLAGRVFSFNPFSGFPRTSMFGMARSFSLWKRFRAGPAGRNTGSRQECSPHTGRENELARMLVTLISASYL